jgi:hypothetical protein
VVDPVRLAEIVVLPAARVVTWNVPVVEPPAIVIVIGTVPATVLLLERLTTNPAAGAAPEIVTVPVDGVPWVTVDGDSATLDSVGGFIVSVVL